MKRLVGVSVCLTGTPQWPLMPLTGREKPRYKCRESFRRDFRHILLGQRPRFGWRRNQNRESSGGQGFQRRFLPAIAGYSACIVDDIGLAHRRTLGSSSSAPADHGGLLFRPPRLVNPGSPVGAVPLHLYLHQSRAGHALGKIERNPTVVKPRTMR